MLRLGLVGGVSVLVVSLGTAVGQQLTVKSATAKAVELQWTGGTGAASLERSSGAAYQKVSAGDAGKYTDSSIEPFGTYKYRINTAGKFSNEVTVGPPPAGLSNAAPAPKGSAYENYGPATAVALDENGDPVIAFEWADPNGDGDKADTEVRFVRWDRATYKWTKPVKVAVTGALADQNVNILAVACDRDSGAVGILIAGSEQLKYAVSSDQGATWNLSTVTAPAGQPHGVALAAAGGQAYAVVNGEDAAAYLTGAFSNSGSWKNSVVPANGWKVRNNADVALALDASGKPALAFYEDQADGDHHRYVFWRPGGGPAKVIADNANNDLPDVALGFGGGKFGALFTAALDEKDTDHSAWFSESADGSSWSKPSKLPVAGPRSTNAPLGVALDAKAEITAAFGSNSGSAAPSCNSPATAHSADGTTWKPCVMGRTAGQEFNAQPSTIHAIEAPNDKAYVLWHEEGETKVGPGVLIWHEK